MGPGDRDDPGRGGGDRSHQNGRVFKVQPATPVEVADAYIEAVNDRDFEASAALFAPGTGTSLIEEKVNLEDWELGIALGWQEVSRGCREDSRGDDGVLVECAMTQENDLTSVLGLEFGTSQWRLLIADGHIKDLTENMVSPGDTVEVLRHFYHWVEENHPADVDTMMTPSLQVNATPESLALWEQYVDEFVAEMQQ